MAQNAPGKHYRKGVTLLEIVDMFGDEEKAKAWIAMGPPSESERGLEAPGGRSGRRMGIICLAGC